MANEQHLINGARKATGDEAIEMAGLFQPKGMAGKEMVGGLAGGAVGDAAGSAAIGIAAGVAAGQAVTAGTSGEKGMLRYVVALSPDKIYVLKPEHFDSLHKEDLELLHTFDRQTAHVEMHSRVSVRTLVIEDDQGQRVALEGNRVWYRHTKPLIHALLDHSFEDEESALDVPA